MLFKDKATPSLSERIKTRMSLARPLRFVGLAFFSLFFLLVFFCDPISETVRGPKFREYEPKKVQFDFQAHGTTGGDKAKAEQVVQAMKFTFWNYRKYAWGADEIQPISGHKRNPRSGWGATIVDSMTTTAIMGLSEEFWLSLNHTIKAIEWGNVTDLVDPFETTIRYLGGMLSSWELMDAGITKAGNSDEKKALLQQAVDLAARLGPAYDSPTGLPWPRVNFKTKRGIDPNGRPGGSTTIGPARAGSNWLEYRTLSKLTGDAQYLRNATRSWSQLVWNQHFEELPGMIDAPIDIYTGVPTGNTRSWDGGSDSYYEYLIKAHIMEPNGKYSEKYRDRWVEAVESTREYLASWSEIPMEGHGARYLFLGSWQQGWLINQMGHLACFAPGNFILGGKYLDREDIIQFGLETLEACHHVYATTATHIGPESVGWIPMNITDNPTSQRPKPKSRFHFTTKAEKELMELEEITQQPKKAQVLRKPMTTKQKSDLAEKGYWVVNGNYNLRPETIESYFYAYRITGDKKYQQWAWDAFQGIMEHATTNYGYAALKSVNHIARDSEGGYGKAANQNDYCESFWSAEVLKYLYLIFSDPEKFSIDDWVFNTEAHPFRKIAGNEGDALYAKKG